MHRRQTHLTPLAAAVLVVCTSLAHAQQANTQSQTAPTVLKEVTVSGEHDSTTEGTGSYTTTAPLSSATKLGLKPRETPQSLSIITRERMEEQGLQTLSQTMQATTGVYVTYNDSERVAYSARGYNITNFQVDGMLNTFGGSLKTNGDNVVYDRIEVVRGATGLTTGAGDPSATINQVRKRPTMQFQGSAAVRLGTYGLRRGEIDLSGPLAFDGKIRGRFVAAQQKADSFRPFYSQQLDALYGIVEADVGPDTTVSLGYERQKSDPRGSTWGTVLYWNADGTPANMPYNQNLSTPWASWNMVENKTTATLEHRFNTDWRVRAAFTHSAREQDGHLYFGFGGNPRPDGSGITVAYGRFPIEEAMNVVDVNLDGKFDAFGRRHDVVFGWGQNKRTTDSLRVTTGAVPAGYGVIPDWRTWTGNVPIFPTTIGAVPTSIGTITQKAGYAATRLHITDPLKVILGVRYSEYETTTNAYAATGALTSTSGYRNSGIFTPYAGVLYDIAPQWTLYGAYTDIFQPQNYRNAANNILDPVVGKSVEAGIKGEVFDKRMNVSAAVFKSTKDNVAEIDDSVAPNSLPGGVQAYRATGKGNKVDGVEFEASGQITRQWNLSAGYSHTRSRTALGVANNTVIPRNLLRVFSTYKFGDGQRWTVGGGINWQSSFWNTAQRPNGTLNASGGAAGTVTSRIDQGGVVLGSLMASYRISDQLTASVNVDNLLNKHYYNRVGFYNGVHWADPRTVTVTLRGTF